MRTVILTCDICGEKQPLDTEKPFNRVVVIAMSGNNEKQEIEPCDKCWDRVEKKGLKEILREERSRS